MTKYRHLFKGVDPKDSLEVLSRAIDHFGGDICMATSLQLGGLVLLDMLHRVGKPVRVFSIDTGRLPEETYECSESIRRKYGIQVEWVFPRFETVEKLETEKGLFSFKESIENRRECCGIRKVEPLGRALAGYRAWITGRRLDQSQTRGGLEFIETDPVHDGLVKVNPLIHWSKPDLWYYVEENGVPHNRLYDEGYLSIGCAPCTRPCKGNEDERAGRWWWESPEHKECGLHLNFKNGGGI
ncbi:phosphoadenylyl-sulfate reductase [Pontiella sp.]|uniref:phosphoadenylyl-sulfate reductase n=1 Tax=Pontiella sp. TaxID=2837462 RepID=UPI003566A075